MMQKLKLKLKYIQNQNIDQLIFSTSNLYFSNSYMCFVGVGVCVCVCVSLKEPKTSVKYEIKFIEVNKNKWAD